uniref:Prolyl endopeptidase n=1 Tax=Strongyloides stercoralis TaxID=6248 RepID=A0AAF5DEG7_STRER
MLYNLILFFNLIFLPFLATTLNGEFVKPNCDNNLDKDYKKRYPSKLRINVTNYPILHKDKNCVEYKFNYKIKCPYQYLDDLENNQTVNFIKNVNKLSTKFLYRDSIRELMANRIKMYNTYLKTSLPEKNGEYYYYLLNNGSQTHAILVRKKQFSENYEVFYNINAEFEAGDRTLTGTCFSTSGDLMAYIYSANGSDWNTVKFKTKSGLVLEDQIENVKFSDMSFIFGEKGFLYSTFRSKHKETDIKKTQKDKDHALYYHVMGTEQNKDILIAKFPRHKKGAVRGFVSNDDNYLYVKYTEGASENKHKIFYYKLSKACNNTLSREPRLHYLIGNFDDRYNIIDTYKGKVIILTTKNAPMGKVIKVRISKAHYGKRRWRVLINHNKNKKIESVMAIGKKYLLVYCIENVTHHIYVHDKKTGELITKLNHAQGVVKDISGDTKSDEFFVGIGNQVSPFIIYRGNLSEITETNKNVTMELFFNTHVKGVYQPNFVMSTKFYKSKDGTYVPIFLFHRKDIQLNGKNPVVLTSYGGFGLSNFPYYYPPSMMFVNHIHGIYAIACIRGGGEYGKEWHEKATLHNKHKSFEDLIGAAEYLINENYTNPSKLVLRGSSNGGIMATVVAQQRPDLFGSVISHGAVYDMLRFHKFTSGGVWISEYGDPDKKKDLKYLLSYSPQHNIKMPEKPKQWPSTFLTAGLDDTRVVASHTLIYAAKLYRKVQKIASYQTNPILVRIYGGQGHSGGVTFRQQLEENIDAYVFIVKTLNAKWKMSYK